MFVRKNDQLIEELKSKISTKKFPSYKNAVLGFPASNPFSPLERPVVFNGLDFEDLSKSSTMTLPKLITVLESPKSNGSTNDAANADQKAEVTETKEGTPEQIASVPTFVPLTATEMENKQQLCDSLFTLCFQANVRAALPARTQRVRECRFLTEFLKRMGKFYARLAQSLIETETASVELGYFSSFIWENPPPPATVAELQEFQEKMASGNFKLEDRFFEVSPQLTAKYPGFLPQPSMYHTVMDDSSSAERAPVVSFGKVKKKTHA
eukprot:CAMPEP_0175167494 /NCGR_PEP_ID=MMETSP0087-20121206/28382_1 /TAXON_ID=136419 /ORGANISM="Unknown Unknown, Strain D1" /LENGTH=266 /DNA_ID=CAMNT_0016457407 /DNA_START=39 /DNA_END=837 /DNA_ORIENTATION=+